MDFDSAINKLERNHSQMRKQSRAKAATHERLQRQAAQRRELAEKRKAEARLQERKLQHVKQYMDHWNNCADLHRTWKSLKATSIHGEGDKIALPPSILEKLVQGGDEFGTNAPLTFRVGIRKTNVNESEFPLSNRLKKMMEEYTPPETEGEPTTITHIPASAEEAANRSDVYLEELQQSYLSYTYCTVVEFTQEEGHIGLPKSVALRLLTGQPLAKTAREAQTDAIPHYIVPSMRTVDPTNLPGCDGNSSDAEDTPGHVNYGAFDLPDVGLEVTLLSKPLPKGTACTLTPTLDALKNGWNNLPNIKATMEQSIVRTRATLCVNDTITCWHKGKAFDLLVSTVTPDTYGAISCINTDIEVDFDHPEIPNTQSQKKDINPSTTSNGGYNLGGRISGNTLGGKSVGEALGGRSGGQTLGDRSGGQTLGGKSGVQTLGGRSGGQTLGGQSGGQTLGGRSVGHTLGGRGGEEDLGGKSVGEALGGRSDGQTLGGRSDGQTLGGKSGGQALGGRSGGQTLGGKSGGQTLGGRSVGHTLGGRGGGGHTLGGNNSGETT